ncbi:MAG: hypothetical protein Q8R48_07625 [Candidatus Omnitrophota bacterium]|nr:hypothetical protein [Candidatus Omnitrophota bacterium]
MKKIFYFLMSILLTVFSLSCAYGYDGTMAGTKKAGGVVLSTGDLKTDYEILGIVSYRSSETMPDKINNELKKQAEDLDADYVIGITYYSGFGYLYGSGTAVKLIKKDKGN